MGTLVVVTGGRDYADWREVDRRLTESDPAIVMHGGASGADSLAHRWAVAARVPAIPVPAPWGALGRGAGPRRNRAMALMALAGAESLGCDSVALLAFPGGRGTASMIRTARDLGIRVIQNGHSPGDTHSRTQDV